jgi:hypothetical protein
LYLSVRGSGRPPALPPASPGSLAARAPLDLQREARALGVLGLAAHHGVLAEALGDLVERAIQALPALRGARHYERCIVVDGTRYGHVLNPKTGWPVRHLASVSVVADLCIVAGSTATIAMLEEERGPAWLEGVGLPHHWVDVNGRVGGSLASRRVGSS